MQARNEIQQRLFESAYRFNFFRAVRLIELFAGDKAPGMGLSPADDPVHFRVKPGFSFPASDIQHISTNGPDDPPRMTINFMGLIGPMGVLPHWYNSHAQNSNYKKDYVFTDFLDLFHQRLVSLFYLAWKKNRLPENYRSDCRDPFSMIFGSLAGTTEREAAVDPAFFSAVRRRLTYFCGLVARTVPTVAAIETIVTHATGAPVLIAQFVERLIPIHANDRTRLGSKNSTLQKDALCGRSIRDASSFFRVNIGPMSWKHYMAFAPHSRNLELIEKLIAYLAGIEYEFDVCLIILGKEIPALGLGSKKQSPILGRTVVLRSPLMPYEGNVVVKATNGARPH